MQRGWGGCCEDAYLFQSRFLFLLPPVGETRLAFKTTTEALSGFCDVTLDFYSNEQPKFQPLVELFSSAGAEGCDSNCSTVVQYQEKIHVSVLCFWQGQFTFDWIDVLCSDLVESHWRTLFTTLFVSLRHFFYTWYTLWNFLAVGGDCN